MFFNRRKRYNGDVDTLLPAFGIDLEEAGTFKLLDILDIAWAQKYSVHEGALLVAYSFASGLCKKGLVERADTFIEDKVLKIQKDWIEKEIVRAELGSRMTELYGIHAAAARNQI